MSDPVSGAVSGPVSGAVSGMGNRPAPPATPARPALLAATDLRIDVDGAPAIEHATFSCSGPSVVVLGESSALLRAVLRQARIGTGRLELLGYDVGRGEPWSAASNVVGIAPLDPPLPPRMTVHAYLVASWQLAGLARSDGAQAATRTLAALGLGSLARRLMTTLARAEARAVVLAQAVVTAPSVLLAQAPYSGLSDADASFVTAVFAAACADRCWICSAAAVDPRSPEHAMATAAAELLVFSSGHLVRQTPLRALESGSTGYTVTVHGDVDAFSRALAARGVALSGGPSRFWIELPAHITTTDLLGLSLETHAPIVELYPRLLGPPRW